MILQSSERLMYAKFTSCLKNPSVKGKEVFFSFLVSPENRGSRSEVFYQKGVL